MVLDPGEGGALRRAHGTEETPKTALSTEKR